MSQSQQQNWTNFKKAVTIDTDNEVPISVTKLLLTPTVSHQATVLLLTPRQVKLQCDHVSLDHTLFSHVVSLWQVSLLAKLSLPLQTPQRQLRLLRMKVITPFECLIVRVGATTTKRDWVENFLVLLLMWQSFSTLIIVFVVCIMGILGKGGRGWGLVKELLVSDVRQRYTLVR